jgi:hypothetical protein
LNRSQRFHSENDLNGAKRLNDWNDLNRDVVVAVGKLNALNGTQRLNRLNGLNEPSIAAVRDVLIFYF